MAHEMAYNPLQALRSTQFRIDAPSNITPRSDWEQLVQPLSLAGVELFIAEKRQGEISPMFGESSSGDTEGETTDSSNSSDEVSLYSDEEGT